MATSPHRISYKEARLLLDKRRKRNKYGAIRQKIDGYTFDSRREARRYALLKLRMSAGEIYDLIVHPKIDIYIGTTFIATYEADFSYYDAQSPKAESVTEDVKTKGTRTPVYILKKKLVEALYNIKIVEV